MNLLKKRWIIFSLAILGMLLYSAFFRPSIPTVKNKPFGSRPGDHYITLTGNKPTDAKVEAYAIFYGGGETCDSLAFSASTGKLTKAARGTMKIEHNYASDPNRYEIRIPYRDFDEKCHMKLYELSFELSNEFSSVFAKVRFVRPNRLDNPKDTYPVTTAFKADKCNAIYHKFLNEERWTSLLRCVINSAEPRSDFNETSILLDFDAFTDSTVITYDIYAGDKYRSTPLDPTKAPE